MKVKITFFLLLACIMLSNVSVLATNTMSTSENTSNSISGNLLSPQYFYLSKQTIANGQNSGIGLSTNNQPGILNAYSYSGTSISKNSKYLPPNYSSNNVTSFTQALGLTDYTYNYI